MKTLLLGVAVLSAVTGFSLLPADPTTSPTPPPAYVLTPGPTSPEPELSIQPIPTDGWGDGLLH